MIGAIVGDIIGSPYEWDNINTTEFELFQENSQFTDDSILTVATAEALLNSRTYQDVYQDFGKTYSDYGYGVRFAKWIGDAEAKPYNSWGNGSAMRVAPVAWAYDTLDEVLLAAKRSAECTHNHPEGIKGAEATAASIYFMRKGVPKEDLKKYISRKFGYNLNRTLDEIRPTYEFDESCQGTVPEAIIAFMESTSFEDCIRKAVSLGGDCDTLTCIAGSIAEAAYGVPENIKQECLNRLDPFLLETTLRFTDKFMSEVPSV